MAGMTFLSARSPLIPKTTSASDPGCSGSVTRREPEAADMAAVRHVFGQLGLAAAEARQQCEVELAHLRILHREFMEDAVVRLDGGHAADVHRSSYGPDR